MVRLWARVSMQCTSLETPCVQILSTELCDTEFIFKEIEQIANNYKRYIRDN